MLAKKISLQVDWEAPIEELPVGIQQKIEILKLLYTNSDILILDEPTAVCTPQETVEFFEHLKDLKKAGKTILLITHKLKEVLALTDSITVFRAGNVTGHLVTSETNEQELANLMVGREVILSQGHHSVEVVAPKSTSSSQPVLEIEQLTLTSDERVGRPLLKNISLTVSPGEIVGIAGIEGNGQSDLLQTLLFPSLSFLKGKKHLQGVIRVLGHNLLTSSKTLKELGVGIIPEDRQQEGLLLDFDLTENYLLGLQDHESFHSYGFLRRQRIDQSFSEAMKLFDVRPSIPSLSVRSLSGGNQQKLILARELYLSSPLLICAQPTRGVDVGAIELIHQTLKDCRDQGKGILLISSELSEIRELSDRIIIFYEGGIVAHGKRGEWDEQTMGLYMGGAKKQTAQTKLESV
jgi:ABC-type uncharacterized transport system ATPase subunit